MEREPPPYDPPDRPSSRRRPRRDEKGNPALAFAYIVLIVVVLGLAIGCPEGEKAANVTTTTGSEATTTSTTGAPTGAPMSFTAQLTGDEEIPAVSTSATGTLIFTVANDGSKVDYVLSVTDLVGVTIGRLREGKSGANGESIMILYDGPKSGSFTGVLVEGSITADDLEGPLKGKTIEDLVTLILADSIYFNLGTDGHSGGEIRGQLQ
jgi:hypothetical protein